MELTIEPDAADDVAEHVNNNLAAEKLQDSAERGEPVSITVDNSFVRDALQRVALTEIQQNMDEVTAGLTRYDAGRVRGIVDLLEALDANDSLPDDKFDDALDDALPASL